MDLSTPTHLLVIGYGNELRRDDGLGPKTASAIEAMKLPSVRVLCVHQLTPELAEPISQATTVVFVDAALQTELKVQRLSPAEHHQLRAHRSDPAGLLTLARDLYNKSPRAWWITAPAYDLNFGEGLSSGGEASLRAALNAFRQIYLKTQQP